MKTDRKIIHVVTGVCLLLILLIAYLSYFELFVKDRVVKNSYNQRLSGNNSNVLRGSIYDRNGKLLAESRFNGDTQERIYPFGSLYSHIIGYDSKVYGKSLLEASYNSYLSNKYDIHAILDISGRIAGYEPSGANMSLTIDHRLQARAEQLLRNIKGAAVVMNPKTGEILAMVSKPDFNPNGKELEKNWTSLVESPDAPFLPRATQGMYAPGSTFKVVASAAAVENGLSDTTFEDSGLITIDGKQFRNSGGSAYGKLDIKGALTVSCNTFFAKLGVDLGFKNLRDAALSFGFEKEIPFDLPVKRSIFPYNEMGQADMASVGIGQGKLLATPLQMAMVASCIANDGIMMKPWLVKRVATVNGIQLHAGGPSVLYRSVSPETAASVRDMMIEAVERGTGKSARIKGVHVAGKTGTAQNELTDREKNKEHAWFIGFAPAEDPEVAVAVIAEYSGSSGGSLCAPIARELLSEYLGS
jgi:peptidoglycan glycosyltransferase